MDHTAIVEDAALNVLSNHEILMAAPTAAKLNSFYPNPSESSSTIAQAVINSGQLIIQANSKRIGGASDFLISTPNILDVPQLNLSFTVDALANEAPSGGIDQRTRAYMCTYHDGWGFDCIDRIEMTVAKSNISNLQLQGHALRDWSLLQCKNADERKQMLKIAGEGESWTVDKKKVMTASIPLSFLFFRAAGGVKGGFPIDGRVLHGPITFQIYFKPIQYFCGPAASVYDRTAFASSIDAASSDSGTNVGASYPSSINPASILPTEFSKLEFTARTYQLMDGVFSVAKALDSNPSLTYSLPSLWLNTYSQEVQLTTEGKGQININSIPAGMLQAIIVRVRPTNKTGYVPYNLESAVPFTAAGDQIYQGDYQSKLNYDPPNFNQVNRPISGGDKTQYGFIETGVTPAYRPYVPWSLPLEELRLEYSGQALYSARSGKSHDNFTRAAFCDDLKTKISGLPLSQNVMGQKSFSTSLIDGTNSYVKSQGTVTMLENLGNKALVDHDTQVIVIPLCHDANAVFRNRDFENLPHYSGSTLQLQFTVAPNNTYTSEGLDREQCYSDGTQIGTDPDLAQDVHNQDSFNDIPRWKPELDNVHGAVIPSNRLQHVALCQGPNNRSVVAGDLTPGAVVPGGSVDAYNTDLRERVIFNNNPTGEGAGAFSSGSGGTVQLDLTYVIASLFQVTNGTSELQL